MNNKGFTLSELLIVIAIIGLLSSLFLLTFPSARKKTSDTQRKSDLKQYQTAIERYADGHSGLYPVFSGSLVDVCVNTPLDVSVCPEDPLGVAYDYEGTSTEYLFYATLEQPDKDGNRQYFVVCSEGNSGETISLPPYANCPI